MKSCSTCKYWDFDGSLDSFPTRIAGLRVARCVVPFPDVKLPDSLQWVRERGRAGGRIMNENAGSGCVGWRPRVDESAAVREELDMFERVLGELAEFVGSERFADLSEPEKRLARAQELHLHNVVAVLRERIERMDSRVPS